MKKLLITIISIIALAGTVFAQAPQGFNYQAVVRNTAGQLMSNRNVGVRISILQGSATGATVYQQTENISTNANGLFTIVVGDNSTQFAAINWSNGPYFIKSEVDPQGGSNYTLSTTQKILAVPYAHYADVARSITEDFELNERDPYFRQWGFLYDSLRNAPTRLSQFINDLNFLTPADLHLYMHGDTLFLNGSTYVILPSSSTGLTHIEWDSVLHHPTHLSQFINDLNFLTAGDITINGDTLFFNDSTYIILPNVTTIEWDSVLNHPTNLSQFYNDLGFITTETQGLNDVIANNNNAYGQIKNLSYPTDSLDAVNKAYVDNAIADAVAALNNRIDSLFNSIDSITNNYESRIRELEHPKIPGTLPGIFSVSANTKVNFSQGNLQYRPRIKTWRFASHQYDIAGSDNNNVFMQAYCSTWVDLFGYGTSGWDGGAGRYMPYETTTNDSEYTEAVDGNDLIEFYANADWGFYNPIINGGNQMALWRTLTYSEWTYLLNLRPNATQLKGMATVESTPGYIILPDDWHCPSGLNFVNTDTSYTTNVYNASAWAQMEAAGAVFLPAAGSRTGSVTTNIGTLGNYWTASHVNGTTGYSFHIAPNANTMQNIMNYSTGCSVRLVRNY